MATQEHSSITDPHLHEPKGVASADLGDVYVANGSGSGTWKKLTKFVESKEGVFASTVAQEPTGLDTPLQVTFGAATSTSNISLAADGTVTILTDGYYLTNFIASFGRTTGVGQAVLALRVLVNGVALDNPTAETLDDGNFSIPFSTTFNGFFTAGTTFKVELIRDSTGVDNGGLYPKALNATGWGTSPSAELTINRLTEIN